MDIRMGEVDDQPFPSLHQPAAAVATSPSVFQTPDMLQPDATSGNLWRLPLEPLYLNKRKQLNSRGICDEATMTYHHCCNRISKCWENTTPSDWVPESLHQETAYSLTLLRNLHTLADITRHKHAYAMDLLVQASLDRQTEYLDLEGSIGRRARKIPAKEGTQSSNRNVKEYEYTAGLCVSDVHSAIRVVHAKPYFLNSQPFAHINTTNAAGMLTRLDSLDTTTLNSTEKFIRRTEMRAARKILGQRHGRITKPTTQKRRAPAGARDARRRIELGVKLEVWQGFAALGEEARAMGKRLDEMPAGKSKVEAVGEDAELEHVDIDVGDDVEVGGREDDDRGAHGQFVMPIRGL